MHAWIVDSEAAVEELLLTDVETNLFLLGLLDTWPAGTWIGLEDHDRLLAVAALLPGLVVPYSLDGAPLELLHPLLAPHRPDTLVGPRATCDALMGAWNATPRIHEQRLYVCTTAQEPRIVVRQATERDVEALVPLTIAMELEDFGRPPRNLEVHALRVRDRALAGRTWVHERDGAIVFLVNEGTRTGLGCQVGGTFVSPAHRGQGLATEGMRAVAHRLLQRHPRVTLHVREANTPAVRAYARAGFRRSTPFRVALYGSD